MSQSSIDLLKYPPEGFSIGILREDQLDPLISGNKFRKLKYHLEAFKKGHFKGFITFGGAFSNHLLAVAAAGKKHGMDTVGLVRGEEWQNRIHESETLTQCQELGMQLRCISRSQYAAWTQESIHPESFQEYLCIPEGGSNTLGVRGCTEILGEHTQNFDALCVSVGTGATLAGIVQSCLPKQMPLGFLALKHPHLSPQIIQWSGTDRFLICDEYTFGGYGKISSELVSFMNHFYQHEQIPLDPVYTGKMLFGIFDLIEKKQWLWGNRILVIHTGGLQGLRGMHKRLLSKNQPGFTYVDALDF